MVDIPTSSEQQQQQKLNPLNLKNHTSTTTSNRIFANFIVQDSLERILYLWSIRGDSSTDSNTIRYIPGLTDIVYPLYLTFLKGHVNNTHISSTKPQPTKEEEEEEETATKVNPNPLKPNEQDDEEEEEDDIRNRVYHIGNSKGLQNVPEEVLEEIEADTYWCLEHLLTAIHDYRYDCSTSYTTSTSKQSVVPSNAKGLGQMIVLLQEIVIRVDPMLGKHLQHHQVEYAWFAFRWMNSLLVRNVTRDDCLLRLWDTYFCEESTPPDRCYYSTFGWNRKRVRKQLHLSGFHSFQTYVCAAILYHYRTTLLKQTNVDSIVQQLQTPFQDMTLMDISLILSQAFTWKETFLNSERQLLLQQQSSSPLSSVTKWNQNFHWPPRTTTTSTTTSTTTPSKRLESMKRTFRIIRGKS